MLGVLAWWWLRDGATPEIPATPQHGPAIESRAIDGVDGIEAANPPSAESTVVPPPVARRLVDGDLGLDAAEEDRRPKISIDGTVIVLDADGEEHAHESGTL